MGMDRRLVLDLLGSGVLLSAAPSTLSAFGAPAAGETAGLAALLLPLSGASSALGLSMQRATRLAQTQSNGKLILPVFDSGDSPEAAARAAAEAVAGGAAMILGPVFGQQMGAVAAAVGSTIPVISFSNSAPPAGGAVFTFGITPSQSVSAILQYARARGVRRVAIVNSGSAWSEQGSQAAQRAAAEIGLQLSGPHSPNGSAELMASLRATEGGLPDAALLAGEAAQFAAYAPMLRSGGVQVLGTMQALGNRGADPASLEGAWVSAPDPAALAAFARSFGAAEPAGTIAALAYDAAGIVATLIEEGRLTRQRLLDAAGFPGVTGAVRFREDGRCVRELAIVTISAGRVQTVGRKAGL